MSSFLTAIGDRCNRGLYRFLWFLSRLAAFVLLDARAQGLRRVPRRGACLLAPNHQSFLDPWLVGQALLRRAHYLARADLFDVPLLGAILARVNCLPVERGSVAARRSLERVGETLRAGEAVVYFPEGTRSPDGSLQPLKRGAARVARETLAPVVPVLIIGTHRVWPRQAKLPRLGWCGLGRLRRRSARDARGIRLCFGAPLTFQTGEELEDFNKRLSAAYRSLADEAGAPEMRPAEMAPQPRASRAGAASPDCPPEPAQTTETSTVEDGERNGRSPAVFEERFALPQPRRRPAGMPDLCATLK